MNTLENIQNNFKATSGKITRAEYYLGNRRRADDLSMAYQLIISVLLLFNLSLVPHAFPFLIGHLLIVFLLWYLPYGSANRLFTFVRFWNPILIVPFNFAELHYLVHVIRPHDLDASLIKIDYALFGVHPTVWLEHLMNPILTEYLQIVYSTFYFLPLTLALLLYCKNRLEELDYFTLIMVYGFYLSYFGYFFVPAVGPRYTLNYLQTVPVSGLWLTHFIRHTLDTLEHVQRDAFPSGHTAMTLLTMYFAYRYHKKYFYVLLIIGTSLIFSTVYLRYHYVIDVIGGFILAVWVIVTAPFLYRILLRLPRTAKSSIFRS